MIDTLWLLVASGLIFLMQPGFMCLEAGLIRAKNSANVAIKNFVDFGISVLLFWAIGYALMFGNSYGGWIGFSDFVLPLESDSQQACFFIFQVMFCSTATTIISGAVAERLKFQAYLLVACITSGFIYPVFGHWVWHGVNHEVKTGWLGQLGFVDFAGSTVVHSVGGWIALAILLIIGPREGRFGDDRTRAKFPASNLPLSVLGTFLIWVGWLGFNGGNTLSFNQQVAGIIGHTVLAGSAGMIAALTVSWFWHRAPEVRLMINGSLGGLVAITAACHAVTTPTAVLVGAIGGALTILLEKLLERYGIDDAIGAVSVHVGGGIWGTLAVAFVGQTDLLNTGLGRWQQLQVQSLGIGLAFLWSFCIPYLLLRIIHQWFPLRVSAAAEQSGLNSSEHNIQEEVQDLFTVMEAQARSQDLSLRVPVEPFTEVGRIAQRYNQVMDSLEQAVMYTDAIVKTASDAILTFRPEDWIILTANPSAECIFGYRQEELVGLSLSQLIQSSQLDQYPDPKFMTRSREAHWELLGQRQDGSNVVLEVGIAKAELGDRSFYTGMFRDISDRKQLETQRQALIHQLQHTSAQLLDKNNQLETALDQLQRTQAQLVQNGKMASLEKMVGGIAHEFNNPVNFILGNVIHLEQYVTNLLHLLRLYQVHYPHPVAAIEAEIDLVDMEFIQTDLPKVLQSLQAGSTRIRDIVRSLRTFSRLDEAALKPIDLHDNLESTLLLLQSRLRGSGDIPSIEVIKHYGNTRVVECYAKQLNQVCLNILHNAIDALQQAWNERSRSISTGESDDRSSRPSQQRFRPRIWIITELINQDWVAIQISNNGPMIPPEIQQNIFDPFFTTKPVGKGVGLGLAESYQVIVEQHGGNLVCHSEESRTTFTLEIPVSQGVRSKCLTPS
jgi:ammonium transporter